MANSKEIVHELYNSLASDAGGEMDEVREVLLKVYLKLGLSDENPPLINRLVNFIFFKEFHEKLKFTEKQQELIRQLTSIGRKAGWNGVYRSDYGDVGQFD